VIFKCPVFHLFTKNQNQCQDYKEAGRRQCATCRESLVECPDKDLEDSNKPTPPPERKQKMPDGFTPKTHGARYPLDLAAHRPAGRAKPKPVTVIPTDVAPRDGAEKTLSESESDSSTLRSVVGMTKTNQPTKQREAIMKNEKGERICRTCERVGTPENKVYPGSGECRECHNAYQRKLRAEKTRKAEEAYAKNKYIATALGGAGGKPTPDKTKPIARLAEPVISTAAEKSLSESESDSSAPSRSAASVGMTNTEDQQTAAHEQVAAMRKRLMAQSVKPVISTAAEKSLSKSENPSSFLSSNERKKPEASNPEPQSMPTLRLIGATALDVQAFLDAAKGRPDSANYYALRIGQTILDAIAAPADRS